MRGVKAEQIRCFLVLTAINDQDPTLLSSVAPLFLSAAVNVPIAHNTAAITITLLIVADSKSGLASRTDPL
jgi:hypothetical protein